MCHPEVPGGAPPPAITGVEVRIDVVDGPLPALLVQPAGKSVGAVLLFHDVYGRSPFYESLTARLASAGFTTLLPDFFFREGPLSAQTSDAASERRTRADSRRMLSDGLSAAEWLREKHPGPVATVGFCMGGNYALAIASERAGLSTVCFYGFPGRPIHFAQDKLSPTPIDLVPQIRGPVLGFWGDQDEGAGMDNVKRFEAAMKEHGHDFELHIYKGVGHGFMAASRLEPGGVAYADACDAWTRTINFLRHTFAETQNQG